MKWLALVFAVVGSFANAQTLRIGLAEDPDVLDPTLARTFVGRIVFAGLCDKLFDLDEKLNIVPQLATSYEWSADNKALTLKLRSGVSFHDGEKLDAQAVKFNLERHKNMQGSNRRGELAVVTSVDTPDSSTVKINLAAPFAPLLAVLTDRAGMMVSPKAAQASGEKFGAHPVCSGPFRFVERVAQDRIVLERFPGYWNKGQIHFDRIVYLPIVDATVRLANLRSGQLDFIERLAPSDVPSLKSDSRFKISRIVEIGYQGITINTGKSELAQKNPLGRDARVREAFELSLDRDAIVKVALEGEGQFEAYVLAWSGRADPDGNLHTFIACKGPLNTSGYCKPEVDEAIEKARTTLDPAQRTKLYDTVAIHVTRDRPIIYLYHRNWLWAHSAKLTGLHTIPDGMVRVQGLQMK